MTQIITSILAATTILGIYVTIDIDVGGVYGTVFFAFMTGAYYALGITRQAPAEEAP